MASRAGKPAQPRPLSCRIPENEKPGGTIDWWDRRAHRACRKPTHARRQQDWRPNPRASLIRLACDRHPPRTTHRPRPHRRDDARSCRRRRVSLLAARPRLARPRRPSRAAYGMDAQAVRGARLEKALSMTAALPPLTKLAELLEGEVSGGQ